MPWQANRTDVEEHNRDQKASKASKWLINHYILEKYLKFPISIVKKQQNGRGKSGLNSILIIIIVVIIDI